ncbi:NAD(P)H-hydrate dehydratase [Gynuella sp.]|uniref:NAD(P)H-hydrate dehydratase n=1 Tax=Gynuella sp. TaxID=2969146 RepID=UPI003D0E6AC9
MLNKVLLSSAVKSIEQQWAQTSGQSTYVLMQRAGEAAFRLIRQQWPESSRFCVVAGTGNNGGDGYILAMLLRQAGFSVTLISAGESHQRGDAERAKGEYLRSGGVTEMFFPDGSQQYDLIVDALLGTGLHGEVRPKYIPFINFINNSQSPVLSLDVPTGIDADKGHFSQHTVQATATLSFIAYKPGLLSGKARAYCGDLHLASLDVEVSSVQSTLEYREGICLSRYRRDPASHKGLFGCVNVVGGSLGMGGALILAAEAAAHMGTGWVMAATDTQHLSALLTRNPAIMARGWDEDDNLMEKTTVVVAGPGMGRGEFATHYLERLLSQAQQKRLPVVLDADGLFWLAHQPRKYDYWVLTPHDGEAARLLGVSVSEIQADRVRWATAIQKKYGGICVLKGLGSITCDGQRSVFNGSGNAGMAKAGSGDVLAGMIGGWLARTGRFDIDVVSEAVWMHGRSGEFAALRFYPESMQAGDLIAVLPEVWRDQSSG